jgi:short-subunit dehydrogenase
MASTGRVVLVVGASSGIGRCVAHELSRRGDALVLAARGRSALVATATECLELGAAEARSAPVDVRDADAVARLVQECLADHGRLDAVVVTAAVLALGRFEDVPADVLDGVVRTNLLGTANVARTVVPLFRTRGRGTLVLLGSLLGHVAVPEMTPYVITKWGVRALARSLALENRDLPGVHVCLVEPGAVDTPIYELCANYLGRQPRAPQPVLAPEQVAERVVRLLEHPRARVSVGRANNLVRAGFRLVPFAYDRLVGPLFRVLGTEQEPAPWTAGNVLEPSSGVAGPRLATTGA